ncbi:hypothetical protein [uncultured Gordonia sp.]|uniref:hypothetical protein n=1 Tax=uncultured Gordonia sp. TaxID=198437 RepID=UPI0025901739|nr:hypothetical protein [uncultured Gordonia sp.]
MPISGYLAPRRERPTAPTPVYDQATKREPTPVALTLDADFRLDTEVEAICEPLARRIWEQPNARGYVGYVEAIVGAVGELCGTVAGLTADAKLRGLDGADRTRARAALRTVTRTSVPTITADMLTDGSWVAPLIELARRDTDALARLLGHQATDRRGGETASDTLLVVCATWIAAPATSNAASTRPNTGAPSGPPHPARPSATTPRWPATCWLSLESIRRPTRRAARHDRGVPARVLRLRAAHRSVSRERSRIHL